MQDAIAKSHTVIVCISREYKSRLPCQKVAKYARQRKDTKHPNLQIVHLQMQQDYTTHRELCMPLWGIDHVATTGELLAAVIGDKGKVYPRDPRTGGGAGAEGPGCGLSLLALERNSSRLLDGVSQAGGGAGGGGHRAGGGTDRSAGSTSSSGSGPVRVSVAGRGNGSASGRRLQPAKGSGAEGASTRTTPQQPATESESKSAANAEKDKHISFKTSLSTAVEGDGLQSEKSAGSVARHEAVANMVGVVEAAGNARRQATATLANIGRQPSMDRVGEVAGLGQGMKRHSARFARRSFEPYVSASHKR
jgi:hypothetical protein